MICIACKNKWQPVKAWETTGIFSQKKYQIEFCECGVGKTIIDDLCDLDELNDKFYSNIEDRINIYYKYLNNHLSVRYIQSLRKVKEVANGNKLLEVGSNIGFTLNVAKKQGFQVTGCEINQKCREISQLLFDVNVEGDLFKMNEKFDIIIMNDVLEHFPDPSLAVKKAYELLNDKGIVFIQLPNIASKEAVKHKGNWKYILAPDHTYHFTPSSLTGLMKLNGFTDLWQRTAIGIYDMSVFKFVPKKVSSHLNHFINNNNFYYPRLYTRKKGELIQAIYQKNVGS